MITNIKFTYDSTLSVDDQEHQNILIKGDNKEILPELIQEYGGKIKCVYIDPPYNNGDSYHYYNDKTSESNWLKDIRKILIYLKILLTKDGSVWISIDDREMAYLKVEADKIFGRENFVTTIVWQQRKTRENRAIFSCNHEYILVYSKNIKQFKKSRNLLPIEPSFINNKYKTPDNDPRGPWQSISASVQDGHGVSSQFYTIVSPAGKTHNPPKGRCWIYNEERMKKEIAEGNIWFGLDGLKVPRIKKFLSSATLGLTPQTLWCGEDYGTTDSAKKHLLSICPKQKKIFETPKPEELIRHILNIATNEKDIVLDCYLGSGTTATTAHKLNRKYIGIEIGNQIEDIVVNRLKKVIEGEKGGISKVVNWEGGGGFSFYIYDKFIENNKGIATSPFISKPLNKNTYQQLNLFSLFDEFGENPIIENDNRVSESNVDSYNLEFSNIKIDKKKNVLISLVKKNNESAFIKSKAKIYYTGKKFPSSISFENLYYLMPYLKGKGIRDLYAIKVIKIGTPKGKQDATNTDLRLIFEIEFIKHLFENFIPIDLKIWRTYSYLPLELLLNLD